MSEKLYYWSWSAISGDTAFFYFEDTKENRLICVEYWADEDRVAEEVTFYTMEGEYLEDSEEYYLSKGEMNRYAEICRKKIAEN